MVIDCVMIQKLKVGGHWCTYLTNRARQVQLPIDLDTPGEHVPSLLRLDPSVLFIYLGWRSAYTLLATTTLQINQCELNDNEWEWHQIMTMWLSQYQHDTYYRLTCINVRAQDKRVNCLCTRGALRSYCNQGVNSIDQQNVLNMHFIYQLLSFEFPVLKICNALPSSWTCFWKDNSLNAQFPIEIWRAVMGVCFVKHYWTFCVEGSFGTAIFLTSENICAHYFTGLFNIEFPLSNGSPKILFVW